LIFLSQALSHQAEEQLIMRNALIQPKQNLTLVLKLDTMGVLDYLFIGPTNHRKTQVATAIEMYKKNIKSYHNRYRLDHLSVNVSQMICDIRH
jgi:hypothetical protein